MEINHSFPQFMRQRIRAVGMAGKDRNVTRNTIGFYMRSLRAVYNQAVARELTRQRNPFRLTYTGVDRTSKRAVPIPVLRDLKHMDLSWDPELGLARDLFLFSFYTRGMSFVDMAYPGQQVPPAHYRQVRPGFIWRRLMTPGWTRRITSLYTCCKRQISSEGVDCGNSLIIRI